LILAWGSWVVGVRGRPAWCPVSPGGRGGGSDGRSGRWRSWDQRQPLEGVGQFACPGPGAREADPDPPLATGDPGGDVQQPVAQLLGFCGGEGAVEEHGLGPGEQVRGGEGELQPDGVDLEVAGREAAVAGVLAGADAVLDAGVARFLASRAASCPVLVLVAKVWNR
jgi:hypothetical protein